MSKYIFTKDAGESPLIGEIKRNAALTQAQRARVPKDTIDEWLRIGLLREVEPKRDFKRKPEVKKNGRK